MQLNLSVAMHGVQRTAKGTPLGRLYADDAIEELGADSLGLTLWTAYAVQSAARCAFRSGIRSTMSMLKFDHEKRPNFQLEHSDFRAHYQNVAAQTLLSIRRHWRFIASCVALALGLAFIIIPLMPRKYSAMALIYPSLYSQDQGKIVALASVDAGRLSTVRRA